MKHGPIDLGFRVFGGKLGGGEKHLDFLVFYCSPCLSQDVMNNTTLLSHVFCSKLLL
jgi:hypothetical protein